MPQLHGLPHPVGETQAQRDKEMYSRSKVELKFKPVSLDTQFRDFLFLPQEEKFIVNK